MQVAGSTARLFGSVAGGHKSCLTSQRAVFWCCLYLWRVAGHGFHLQAEPLKQHSEPLLSVHSQRLGLTQSQGTVQATSPTLIFTECKLPVLQHMDYLFIQPLDFIIFILGLPVFYFLQLSYFGFVTNWQLSWFPLQCLYSFLDHKKAIQTKIAQYWMVTTYCRI